MSSPLYLAQFQAVFFDLDGTLVDSAADIRRALNLALNHLGLPCVDDHLVRRWVGRGAATLVHCAVQHVSGRDDLHAPLLAQFMHYYQLDVCVESTLYDGALTCLDTCQSLGLKLACITNKPYEPARALLDALNILTPFSLLLGGDSLVHRKPHPEPLLHALSYYQLSAPHALMVGDSSNDIEAAQAAGLASVGLTYGYNHGVDIRDSKPDLVLDSLRQLR